MRGSVERRDARRLEPRDDAYAEAVQAHVGELPGCGSAGTPPSCSCRMGAFLGVTAAGRRAVSRRSRRCGTFRSEPGSPGNRRLCR
jgi:hypothetical protein